MRKLKFKILVHEDFNEIISYDENNYNDNQSLNEIIRILVKKYTKNSKNARAIILNFYEMTWGQFFNMSYELCDERKEYEYYKYKIGALCEQFNLENQIIVLAINPPIGGGVGINRGIHYFFHTNEKDIHHVPHIHVKSGSIEFRVNLNTLEIMDKNIFKNNKKNKLALDMIKKNQQGLINYWNKVVINGESIKFKMFFPC